VKNRTPGCPLLYIYTSACVCVCVCIIIYYIYPFMARVRDYKTQPTHPRSSKVYVYSIIDQPLVTSAGIPPVKIIMFFLAGPLCALRALAWRSGRPPNQARQGSWATMGDSVCHYPCISNHIQMYGSCVQGKNRNAMQRAHMMHLSYWFSSFFQLKLQ
jgi:hypothetical protein